ncbi:cytochrome P450 [Mycobacterium talmoniae]|uniref:Cytochrome n=1 Tax=Mycobacterium talmoniae TaxID=1858794 RepID=A0A1S1NGR4_9MYCO|nr:MULTISPECIES: cytochrome P450 [Mycobacterium]OHV01764.1 cytochrome [Mycobacterium talmoniae]PQM47685.1 Putative cytochrome P450 126 [Mycobacterium talmoniae]TDH56546.1 cytochrome P450 [Mycobacterium eburneum]
MTTADLDLSDVSLWRNGFPDDLFTELRRARPLFRHEHTPGVAKMGVQRDFWMTTKHRHAVRIHRDADSFTAQDGPLIQPIGTFSSYPTIINMDPPQLSKRRRLIANAFTPRAIARLEDGIRTRAARMVDGLLAGGGGDWIADVADALPMTVIGDILGMPEQDRPRIFTAFDRILTARSPNARLSEQDELELYGTIFGYAMELTAQKRREPADDIWSTLASAVITGDDGEQFALPDGELEIFFFVLAFAGSDTTKNALAGGLQAFVANPEQIGRYRDEEAVRSSAVEEVLRWTTPVAYWTRSAKVDLEIDGQHIPKGDRVVSMLRSANRDEEVFDDPFTFDIGRDPNPHVAFGGGGPHHCLGAMLARAEIHAVLDELLLRGDDITLGPATVAYPNLTTNMSIYDAMPIAVRAR